MRIFWSEKLNLPYREEFRQFAQRLANAIAQGNARYGDPDARKQYLRRLRAEVKAYVKTGNAEHLINIAVYAWLELIKPQHARAHYDPNVKSVTRKAGADETQTSACAYFRDLARGG